MAVMKKLLFSGIGLVAIAGAATGIGVVINNSRTIESSIDETGTKPTKDPDKKPDTSIQPMMIELKKLVEEIKPENIIFTKKSNQVEMVRKSGLSETENTNNKKDTYAFDVSVNELDLDESTKKKLEENKVKAEILLDKNIANGIELNQGSLLVTIKATLQEGTKKNEASNTVNVTGFKASSSALTSYLKQAQNESKEAILDLTKAIKEDNNPITLTTIETLNNKAQAVAGRSLVTNPKTNESSGLTTLFQKLKEPMQSSTDADLKTVAIVGQVKLNKISKDSSTNTTIFHLAAAKNNEQIRLVQTKEDKQSAALVNEVLVTNLLATKVGLEIEGIDQDQDQMQFLAKYKSDPKTTNKYEEYKENEGLVLKVKKTSERDDQGVNVFVRPSLIKRIAKDQEIKANLVISYGSNETIKTYSTKKHEDIKELKDSGVSFFVYSKKLAEKEEVVTADKLTNEQNKLDSFFNKKGMMKGISVDSLKETSGNPMNKPIGGFSLISSSSEDFASDFVIGKVTSTSAIQEGMRASLDTQQENWDAENWISFVGYSFEQGLKNKVLFEPIIHLIRISEVKAKTEPSPGPIK